MDLNVCVDLIHLIPPSTQISQSTCTGNALLPTVTWQCHVNIFSI